MKRVTLYNHVRIGTDDKPLIRNAQFKNLCIFLENGHTEAFEYYIEKYTMVPAQISCAKWIIEKHETSI